MQNPQIHLIGRNHTRMRAFERIIAHYRYHADLFPTHTFRMAYDALKRTHTSAIAADKVYLRILHLAATVCESGVEAALEQLLANPAPMTEETVQRLLDDSEVQVPRVDLCAYDALLMPQPATGGLR